MNNRRKAAVVTAAGSCCLAAATAFAAGGLGLMEIGTSDLGLAGAGYAARAQDAATAFTNPAGMTRIKGNDFVLGAQLLYGDVKFSPNGNTVATGNDGGTAVGWLPGGNASYVYSLSNDVRLGVSMASNFGLAATWDDNWVGRYIAQKVALIGATILPSVAFRASDTLSFGVGLNAMYGYLRATTKINNLPLGGATGDGELNYKDSDWGFGGTLGMLYEPSPQTRFGVTYTSKIDLNFSAQPEFANLGVIGTRLQNAGLLGRGLDIGITVPQAVMTSFYHELDSNRRWALLGNLGWQQWSKFGYVDINVASTTPTSLTTPSKYKDTWHAALGAQYQYSEPWLLSGGIAYDSGMVNDADRSIALPVGATWAFGIGTRYKMRDGYDVSFNYELKYAGDLPVDNGGSATVPRVAGEYGNTALHFFGATFHWRY